MLESLDLALGLSAMAALLLGLVSAGAFGWLLGDLCFFPGINRSGWWAVGIGCVTLILFAVFVVSVMLLGAAQ